MERVYKRESIIFKILPCILIAMYAIMCLFGSYVCAASNKTYHLEPLNYDFTLNVNDTFDSNNIKVLMYNYIYVSGNDNLTRIHFVPIFYTGTAYFDKDNQQLHIKNGAKWYMSSGQVYDENKLEDISKYYQDWCDDELATMNFSWLANEKYFEEDSVINLFQKGCSTKTYYAVGSNEIYDYTNPDDVVFHPASPGLATLITPQVKLIDFSQVLTEVLQILLIALPVVILVIALMKAISLLFQVLRNA